MKLKINQLTAAFFATVILTSTVLADATWASRPQFPAQQGNVSKPTAVKTVTSRARRTVTIAIAVRHTAPQPAPVSIPHNLGNGTL